MSKVTLPLDNENSPRHLLHPYDILAMARRARVASGIHHGSRISAYNLSFESRPQVSVFIYPDTYTISRLKIMYLDNRFSKITEQTAFREFKELSVEDLERLFLKEARPHTSIMSHSYETSTKIRIIGHTYSIESEPYLRSVIRNLKA